MQFDTSNLRADADTDEPIPYRERQVTLVHVDQSGTVTSDHTVYGKKEIMDRYRKGHLLLAAWTGQRRTDVFSVTPQKVRKALRG